MDKAIAYINSLLMDSSVADEMPEDLAALEGMADIDATLRSFRDSMFDISNGELDQRIHGRGYLIGTVKNLQATLKNLVWHIKVVSSGDFSQEVVLLGEFSDAFNTMVKKLEKDIQDLKDKEEEILRLSEIDGLTKLYNRKKLDALLDAEISRAGRKNGVFCIAIMDVDDFKKINDTYGHLVGDNKLRVISMALKNNFRKSDIAGRWGGEEFLIILPDTDLEAAQIVVERVRQAIEETSCTKLPKMTVSFGVAEYSGSMQATELLNRADKALYQAKRTGKNQVCVYQDICEI